MINEKELRVGNCYATARSLELKVKGVDTVNKFVVVEGTNVDLEITSKSQNTIIFEDLNPIELTEPKLASLGFLSDKSLSLSITSDNDTRFVWDDQHGEILIKDAEKGSIGQSIKHLHQLQNIYYFLTGKELAI